ncbi:MAG: isoaspartyl peptidase/L-asparaginase [Planctomycetota bacterium]|nr:isoaspartyl peptidase/L-asparaginase [Planctomycetota bacterium]
MTGQDTWAVAIHGGAGVIARTMNPEVATVRRDRLNSVLQASIDLLSQGMSALDVVEQAVVDLEEAPEFNAGRGAVLTATGSHELEAAIMDGHTGACGAVCLVETVRNPIRLARRVLDQSPHVLLAGKNAEALGEDLERVANEWFTTELRLEQWRHWKATTGEADARGPATVGAVSRDITGRLAAATSTGGRTGKPPGRIGDTPTIGAGTWADQRCAVSGTGHGEAFMASVAAYAVASRMELLSSSLEEATHQVVKGSLPAGSGGLIAVDAQGNISMPLNAEGMYRAAADASGKREVAIWI